MRIRIESDGCPTDTKITDAETGRPLRGVTAVSWSINATNEAVCKLTLCAVPVVIEGQAKLAIDVDGELRTIEVVTFADGTRWIPGQ